MATISKFNRPTGDPVPAQEEPQKEIPKASFTVMPPRFQPKPPQSPQEEYDEVLKEIEAAKENKQSSVIIKHDLQDLAWQKLSQAGYKLQRKVLDRAGDYDSANVGEKDPNKVEFEISLTEFNRTDI